MARLSLSLIDAMNTTYLFRTTSTHQQLGKARLPSELTLPNNVPPIKSCDRSRDLPSPAVSPAETGPHANPRGVKHESLAILLLGFLLLAHTGCALVGAKPLPLDPRKWQDLIPPKPRTPMHMVDVWTDTVLSEPGQKPLRGFGGRIMFFEHPDDKPIVVDGTLTVYVFEDENAAEPQTKPLCRYVFLPEHLRQHYSRSKLGHSYSVWIPVDELGSPRRRLMIIARFEDAQTGQVIVSRPVRKTLPGPSDDEKGSARKDSAENTAGTHHPPSSGAKLTTPQGDRIPEAGTKSYRQNSPEGPSPPSNSRSRVESTTIEIPPDVAAKLLGAGLPRGLGAPETCEASGVEGPPERYSPAERVRSVDMPPEGQDSPPGLGGGTKPPWPPEWGLRSSRQDKGSPFGQDGRKEFRLEKSDSGAGYVIRGTREDTDAESTPFSSFAESSAPSHAARIPSFPANGPLPGAAVAAETTLIRAIQGTEERSAQRDYCSEGRLNQANGQVSPNRQQRTPRVQRGPIVLPSFSPGRTRPHPVVWPSRPEAQLPPSLLEPSGAADEAAGQSPPTEGSSKFPGG
ncbi:MAG: hypothetical protein NZ899_02805 [Thermoguttaceae bacterium]|nr:hypothetical protein [Thermoguttaceae bacterium]MDW8079743.1 hypothetical protein [Thermoguttaceae bacterium]